MIFPLVVVYNRSCADSETCQSLLRQNCPDLPVLIFDNSTRDFGNREFCESKGWIYLGGSGNLGLSKAYNIAAAYLLNQGREGYLCLLDDDTTLSDDFISAMAEGIEKAGSGAIFVPILMQNGGIISPNRRNVPKKRMFFGSVEECMKESAENLQAFNSCMTINLEIFRDYRYDERQFMDCVDHAFVRDMRQLGRYLTVLPVICEHGFSGNQKGSLEGALNRYRILAHDASIYYENSRLEYWRVAGRRALHLCLQYKTLTFLKLLFYGVKSASDKK